MRIKVLLVLSLCVGFELVVAQSFTKITDLNNPIVQDQYESGGGAWIDFNNDGLLDLFVANGNLTNQQNSLYLNLGNGNFKKITTGAIITDGGSSIGSTWADFDNDGFLDVFVVNRNNFGNFLYLGNGDTTFTKVMTGPVVSDLVNSNSASWVDVNNNGLLDLFVINFQSDNFLFLNQGNRTFAKETSASPTGDGTNFSIHGLWADFNNDRLPDLFIGNGGSQNDVLYRNQGGNSFETIPFNDGKATIGSSWGDYNNDGYTDLFVANTLNQENILYRNSGPPTFSLAPVVGSAVSLDMGNSVGSSWADFNNDGVLDLFVANDGQNNLLYMNSGPPNYEFTKIIVGEIVNDGGNSFGAAAGDYDNDGDLDMFVANRLNQQNFLYRNNGNSNNWLKVQCVGTVSNKSAIGTKVRIRATIMGQTIWQKREVSGMTGYNSQTLQLHFGLATASLVDSLIVEWPSGLTEVHTNIVPDQTVTVRENSGITAVPEQGRTTNPEVFFLGQNYPNPFNPVTNFEFQVPTSGFVQLHVYSVLGNELATIVNEHLAPGVYRRTWDAHPFPSGVYYYRLQSSNFVETRKMILLK
ncbi:MAG TPA: FG-GAP-like repeat-containing protein [Bacteroidota bacterium]